MGSGTEGMEFGRSLNAWGTKTRRWGLEMFDTLLDHLLISLVPGVAGI